MRPDASPVAADWKSISISGANEHNLDDVDVDIPKKILTVVTGVSGSGKSSLVFDTVAAESQRQFYETLPAFVRGFLPSHGRPQVELIEHLAPAVVVDQRRLGGGARSTVGTITDIAPFLRVLFSRAGDPYIGASDAFSFNMPAGMCPSCEGLGQITDVDLDVFVDRDRSLDDGALVAAPFAVDSSNWHMYARSGRLDPAKKLRDFSDDEWFELLHSTEGTVPVDVRGKIVHSSYEGAVAKFRRLYIQRDTSEMGDATKRMLARFVSTVPCPACGGTRLSEPARESTVCGYGIADLSALEATELVGVLKGFDVPEAQPVVDALVTRVQHLDDIGLGYLSLDRASGTLSGGESQRIKIVRQLASTLSDLLYVLDEPSIGLHARDVGRLVDLLAALRDKGNTVLVVEHDRDVIASADHVIDIGPGPGNDGGRVVFQGDVAALRQADTPTGRHMDTRPVLKEPVREPTGWLPVRGRKVNNLRPEDVSLPTGVLTAVTGVAGSGKSSLIHTVFCKQYPEAIVVDQSAPSTNSRSSIATYSGAMTGIRKAFAKANDADPGLFSANSAGACPNCGGTGVVQSELAFLDGVSSVCDVCEGRRFTEDVLGLRLDGRSISDVLEMTVDHGLEFFRANRAVAKVLRSVSDVGLGYLRIGQNLGSLSGGECQRIKLASHLHREGVIYVLDEPTTGLHMSDVDQLLGVLDRLVDGERGTVVVIEHNLEVVAHADWVIDMGPEGGSGGGEILFRGRPADLVSSTTYTAEHLRRSLGALVT